jgi:hypothetical protein
VELNQLEEVLIITEGVHQQVPSNYRPQAPTYLMPLPPADPLISGELPPGTPETTEGVGVEGPGQGAAAGAASSAEPATDADRLEQRYRAVGAAQGHVFGEGAPGTKPPNFNLGLTPPAEIQPQKPAQPSRESTPAAGDSVSRATGTQPQGTARPPANPPAVSPPAAEAGRAERSPGSVAPAVAR